jgi:hypothetical protein
MYSGIVQRSLVISDADGMVDMSDYEKKDEEAHWTDYEPTVERYMELLEGTDF